MTIRTRIILIIIAVAALVTILATSVGIYLTRSVLLDVIETDMLMIRTGRSELLSQKIGAWKMAALAAARNIAQAEGGGLGEILRNELAQSEFLSFAVFDAQGLVAVAGRSAPDDSYRDSAPVRRAFRGETGLSSTEYAPDGTFVIRVCVPLGDRVLVAALPGLIIRDNIALLSVWKTGSVFIIDREGTLLAHIDKDMVLKRDNVLELARIVPEHHSEADRFFRRMIQGEEGKDNYFLLGRSRLTVFTPIAGADGWSLGVVALVDGYPLNLVLKVQLLSALLLLGFGTLSAVISGNHLSRPFKFLGEQNLHLAELRREAEAASKAKSSFLANMSNDMRTPINAIIGFAELAREQQDNFEEFARENLEKIYVSGVTLLGLINDILDISKVESGKFELIPSEYDTPSLINDTIVLNIIRIGSKPINFSLKLDENLPKRLRGDVLKIKQILNNLLSNAFKYTEKGEVEFSVGGRREGSDFWLTVGVRDTGPGLRPEDQARLFEGYFTVNRTDQAAVESTGLGLPITKKIVEFMGGALTVESEYGQGSFFTVTFPQQLVDEEILGPELAGNLRHFNYAEKKREQQTRLVRVQIPYAQVLVVDDTTQNLDVAKGMLRRYGMQVHCVTRGAKAVELIRAEKVIYNAIFMDHMMPEMDGLEAARLIREEIGTDYAKNIPIIALTANAIVGNEKMFLENGFSDFLSKPIDILLLDAVINRWVRDRKLEQAMNPAKETETSPQSPEQPPPDLKAAVAGLAGLDYDRGLAQYGGDEEMLEHSLRSFLKNIPAQLELVRGAGAGTALTDYAIAIHGLKSSCCSIGAQPGGDLAKELEMAAKRGDESFVQAHNGAFVLLADQLLADLAAALGRIDRESSKPLLAAPDPAVLARLLAACRDYDMDAIDAAMRELETARYSSGDGLVAWLREQVNGMELERIVERLTGGVPAV